MTHSYPTPRSADFPLAIVVDWHNGFNDPLRRIEILARLEQRQRILGEATPAIARPCMQELGTDAIIQANDPRNVLHVSPHLFAQIGNLINESDLGRQKRICGIIGEFGDRKSTRLNSSHYCATHITSHA